MANDFEKQRNKFDEDWDKSQRHQKLLMLFALFMFTVFFVGCGWVVYTLVTWVITK